MAPDHTRPIKSSFVTSLPADFDKRFEDFEGAKTNGDRRAMISHFPASKTN
jgi:hypothetical protein